MFQDTQKHFFTTCPTEETHFSSAYVNERSRTKGGQKYSVKALCYFYKPTDVNPREIKTISLTTCFSQVLTENPGRGD